MKFDFIHIINIHPWSSSESSSENERMNDFDQQYETSVRDEWHLINFTWWNVSSAVVWCTKEIVIYLFCIRHDSINEV